MIKAPIAMRTAAAAVATAALTALMLAGAPAAFAEPAEPGEPVIPTDPTNPADPSNPGSEAPELITLDAVLDKTSVTYNGTTQKPTVIVTDSILGVPLPSSSYFVEWDATPKAAGTYHAVVIGNELEGVTGTKTLTFTVKRKALTEKGVKLAYTSKVYARHAYKPSVTVKRTVNGAVRTLKKGRDYTVTYQKNCTSAGTHKVYVKGIGNYKGTVTKTYKITRRPLTKFNAQLASTIFVANGTKHTPKVTVTGRLNRKAVTLKRNRDFTVTYLNNVNHGIATAVVKGKGNFKGTKKLKFVVTSANEASMHKKINDQSSRTKYIIAVSCNLHRVAIYQGSKGNWKQIKFWKCTNGAPATPSRKGVFTVGSRGLSFGAGYTCWYWTQWSGNYLFHSVLYNPGSKTSIQDGRLGIAASHGCIRLALDNARWIYNNIPRGTKVVVY
ncbi:MAG: L,D-transpeptidase [Coriobacteriia bacterium]|nr:L,D-transpeptidase [Coriobacteriia bacterium]